MLTDGTEITTPLAEWENLQETPIGRHLILFLSEEGEVQGYVLAHDSEDT